MDYQRMADQAVEQVNDTPHPSLRPVEETRLHARGMYVVDGVGLWRAHRHSDGVTMSRLFSSQELLLTLAKWTEHCASGRIREVS